MLLVRDVDRLIASMRRQNKLGELDLLELPVWAKQLEQEGAGRQLRALETIVRELKVRYPLGSIDHVACSIERGCNNSHRMVSAICSIIVRRINQKGKSQCRVRALVFL